MDRPLAPGSRIYKRGEPITVLNSRAKHTDYIPGHHSWTTCLTQDLHWYEEESV